MRSHRRDTLKRQQTRQRLLWISACLAILPLAWGLSTHSFLLFHSIAEMICVIIGATAFIVAWNTRQFHNRAWISVTATALLSVGAFDLLHLLAYKGMSVFPDRGANLGTELWIASRYVLSISLLLAGLLVGRESDGGAEASMPVEGEPRVTFSPIAVLLTYLAVTTLLFVSIFWWNIFPDSFAEPEGLTPFKKVSEYVIALILLASGIVFWMQRRRMDRSLLRLLLASIAIGIATGLCFTLYQNDVYGLLNWLGHLLKVGSYGLIYGAVVLTNLQRPYAVLFRDLKKREDELLAAKVEAESANQAKDQFIAVLSHELRNPLNPVLAHVSSLQLRPDLPEEVREELGIVRRNVELEARLIDDLLDLTQIARGKLNLILRPVDLHGLIRHAVSICEQDLKQKRLKLDVQLKANGRIMEADAARLVQVFWNVLKNAIKFSPEGGVVHVATEDVSTADTDGLKGAAALRLIVADEGIGIEPDQMNRIFDAFQQGSTLIPRRFGGLGLGLSISRRLTELHGGRIYADSEGKDRGSRFIIELPVLETQPVVQEGFPEVSLGRSVGSSDDERQDCLEPAKKNELRLLLVEDHEDTARIMSRLLRKLGHQVVVAGSVAEGLRAAEEHPIDFVVSDLGLPDGTGLDLMRKLRRDHGLCGICLSGYGMAEDIQRSHEAGFIAHLVKPVAFESLRDALSAVAAGDSASSVARAAGANPVE